jgi:steroid delta-isomerase-like uncharacterized protein
MNTDMGKLIGDYLAAWNSHDTKKVLSFFTEDIVYEDVAVGVVKRGKKELNDFIDEFFTGFPDLKFEVRNHFFSMERSCREWVMTGTHSGDLPKLPATGRTIKVRGAGISEVKGDKISRHTDYYDMVTLLRQLGVLPPAPPG